MSTIHEDIVAALSSFTKLYPQHAPEGIDPPLITYEVLSREPLSTLNNSNATAQYLVEFDCYADKFSDAIDQSESLRAALLASALTCAEVPSPGEVHVPEVGTFMQPVFFTFWKF